MSCGAIKGYQNHPFASGSTKCHALLSLGCNRRQSNSPVCLGQHRIPSTALHGLGCNRRQSTSPGAKYCMAWGAIEGNQTHSEPTTAWPGVQSMAIELTRLPGVSQDAKHCMAWGAIELTRLPPVAQDAKHCMSWDAIEGNRTHPFAWGITGCQALHGLGCN